MLMLKLTAPYRQLTATWPWSKCKLTNVVLIPGSYWYLTVKMQLQVT